MQSNVSAPHPLIENEDIANVWKIWKSDFMTYVKASNALTKSDEIKIFLLKSCIGEFGEEILEKISKQHPKCLKNFNTCLTQLDNHFLSKYEIQQRYKFFTIQTFHYKTIFEFINVIKEIANDCNFGSQKDDLIRDKILSEIKDRKLLEQLLDTENLKLSNLIFILQKYTSDRSKLKQDTNSNTNSDQSLKNINKTDMQTNISEHNQQIHRNACWRCGTRHPIKSCPAFGSKCLICGNYNHYTNHCRRYTANKANANTTINTKPNTTINTKPNTTINTKPNTTINTKPNTNVPSAPSFKDLYPNLNNAPAWSWIQEPQVQTECVQRNELPTPKKTVTNSYSAIKNTKKSNDCVVA